VCAAADALVKASGEKILLLDRAWDPAKGAPVFTRKGIYTAQGWTEWTQGFVYGMQALQFDATGDDAFLSMARRNIAAHMPAHLTYTGVHDHGFNTVSTYGNLRRLAIEARHPDLEAERALYDLAIRVSGAVQATRWTPLHDGTGFVHSFNGPHSLFVDTIRSCRVLVLADRLGHVLCGENDRRISLLHRAIQHIRNTIRYNIYFGEGRDHYDTRGRVAHESIFNTSDGHYRCPSTQQGYSPFSTWTRGLAWALLGLAEQMEFIARLDTPVVDAFCPKRELLKQLKSAATATADFYLANTPADGIPYWDTGAPGLARMEDWRDRAAEPENPHEPVDSSAAAIAAQGLLRLGHCLGREKAGKSYWGAGMQIATTLFAPPYLSTSPRHQGLLLHTVYHRPQGWDHAGKDGVPRGESALWGDYHALELAVYLKRALEGGEYLTFFSRI